MIKDNPRRHLYLYAKGWYVKTDIIDDVRKICEHICGHEYVEDDDISYWLLSLTHKHITNEDKFHNFINELVFSPNAERMEDRTDKPLQKLVDSCLSVLRFAAVNDIDMELGMTDINVLQPIDVEEEDKVKQ